MIKAIIIDDEKHCIKALQSDLHKNCPSVEVLQICMSAKEGLLAIKKMNPDLVFLDVEMPWMNGFEMLDVLDKIDFSIIFTTAHDQFAAKAFRISAIDYLLKPVDVNDLKEAVQKAEKKLNEGSDLEHISNLLRNLQKPAAEHRVALPHREGYEFVNVSSIIYCEAEGSYTRIMLEGKKPMLISKPIGDIEELLPPEMFQRIHHSTLANIEYISQFIRGEGGYVILKSGEKLAVSKGKKDQLMNRLGLR